MRSLAWLQPCGRCLALACLPLLFPPSRLVSFLPLQLQTSGRPSAAAFPPSVVCRDKTETRQRQGKRPPSGLLWLQTSGKDKRERQANREKALYIAMLCLQVARQEGEGIDKGWGRQRRTSPPAHKICATQGQPSEQPATALRLRCVGKCIVFEHYE